MNKLPPALAAYITRLGAEQLNFKSFMIRIWKEHYYVEKDVVRITDDAEIICNKPEYAPTEKELEALAKELPAYVASWPRTMNAEHTDGLLRVLAEAGRPNPKLFEFYDRINPGIIFAQERVEKPDGKKSYYPWSYFTDGVWRMMEPMHSALPFWKPKDKRNLNHAMVHEGPKVAQYIDRLVNDPEMRRQLAKHPWAEVLSQYEHWGAIGGALAPHRTNYEELIAQRFKEVVYVCDNDYAGKAVAQEFSRHYRRSMKSIMFSEGWPKSWDMADDIPAMFFNKEGRYIGPSLYSLMRPATRATEIVIIDKKRVPKLLPDFCEEWLHSLNPDAYINRNFPDRLLRLDTFNDAVAPFSDAVDTARLMKQNDAVKSWRVKYDPSQESGVQDSPDGQFINTYVGPTIEAVKGDVTPFLEFMAHLVPNADDRMELMRWCATLIACPAVRMNYGVLLISETQGVGKGTLGEKILVPLVGELNSSVPSETDVVQSQYNYWLAHKRLAVVHEIYAGHSSKAYNRLKSTITDDKVTVSKKYVDEYTIENWIHIFACSNSARALQLTMEDRRWLLPAVTEVKRNFAYWAEFNDWLMWRGGLSKIRYWALEFVAEHNPVCDGQEAPWTTRKREIIEEGYSPGMQIVDKLLAYIEKELGEDVFLTDTSLVDVIKLALYEGKSNDRLERPLTLRKLAKHRGWHISQKRAHIEEWGTRLQGPRLLCRALKDAEAAAGDLAAAKRAPLDVVAIYTRLAGM